MMTDREDQNIEAEEEPNNDSLSNQESAEKQSKIEVVVEPYESPRKEQLKLATYELYNLEKSLTKKLFHPWNRSYLPRNEEREKKMKEGRIVIKDDGHKLAQENVIVSTTTTATSSRKGKGKVDFDYPLPLVHELIVKFMLYVGNLEEMAAHRHKSEDDWIRYLESGIEEFQEINEILKKLLTEDMLWVKEEQKEKYIRIHKIMCQLEEINTLLDDSREIGIVTDRDLTTDERVICELRFKRCNNKLAELDRSMVIWEYDLEHGTKG